MKKALSLMMVLVLALSLCSFSAVAEENEAFTMAYNGVVTLNPLMTQASNDHNVLYLTQLQLVRFYEEDVVLDGAEDYSISEDGTVYTFTLREGLKWSDGVDLTAADFEYYVKLMLDPEMGSPTASQWYVIQNAEAYCTGAEGVAWEDVGCKALDERTLEITLAYPQGSFIRTVACKHLYPLRQDFVESIGVTELGSSVDTMLYSGGYVMTNWVLESSIDLVKNELYWDAENSFPVKEIHLIEVDDANTEVAMFENGEVDAIEVVDAQYYDYLADYQYKVNGGGFMFLWMNNNGTSEEAGKVMSNVNFRQALNYAFNREAVCYAVNKATTAANRAVDPSMAGVNGGTFVEEFPVNTVPTTGDVEKAKEYLAAALSELGYSDVSELPQMSMVTWDTAEQKLLCETVIDQWKQNLGITSIQLNQYQIGTAIGCFYDLTYDIFMITWESDVMPTDAMNAMTSTGEANPGLWSCPEFDELIDQARHELDPVKQAELTQQAEQLFLDMACVIPVYVQGDIHAVQPYVSGFVIGSSDGFEFQNLTVSK